MIQGLDDTLFKLLAYGLAKLGGTSAVEWPLPGGGRGRTTWTVDPDSSTVRIIFDPRAKRPNLELPLTEFERYWHERTVFAKPGTPLHQDLTEDLLHEVRSRR